MKTLFSILALSLLPCFALAQAGPAWQLQAVYTAPETGENGTLEFGVKENLLVMEVRSSFSSEAHNGQANYTAYVEAGANQLIFVPEADAVGYTVPAGSISPRYNMNLSATGKAKRIQGLRCVEYRGVGSNAQMSVWVAEEIPFRWNAFPVFARNDYAALYHSNIQGFPLEINISSAEGELLRKIQVNRLQKVAPQLVEGPGNLELRPVSEAASVTAEPQD